MRGLSLTLAARIISLIRYVTMHRSDKRFYHVCQTPILKLKFPLKPPNVLKMCPKISCTNLTFGIFLIIIFRTLVD